MKQKLLKPPPHDGGTFFQPELDVIRQQCQQATSIGIAHQPGFYHPGISFKFQTWQALPSPAKRIVFVDTDKAVLNILLPDGDQTRQLDIINSERTWRDYPNLTERQWTGILTRIEDRLKTLTPVEYERRLEYFLRFKNILLGHLDQALLKELLSRTFLGYADIQHPYQYVSTFLIKRSYQDFARLIYYESDFYRQTFNAVLDEYKQRFQFRYKNYPFPALEKDELPFWILRDQQRHRCFQQDWDVSKNDFRNILPRASTLMLYLRLCHVDFFIHDISGGNYEWVHDRVIERFFKKDPRPYAVISRTQLIPPYPSRTFPYFLFEKNGVAFHK